MKRRHQFLSSLGLLALQAPAMAISLTTVGASYLQNFDTLSNTGTANAKSTLPEGWDFNETGGGAANNGLYRAGTGSDNTGDTYSFGAAGSNDRALGSLTSGSLASTFGAVFTNNTGVTITSLDISFTGEQWRGGDAATVIDRLVASFNSNTSSITSGTFVAAPQLDFATVNTGSFTNGGNLASNQAQIQFLMTGLSIANGQSFALRWADSDIGGSDDGLAIDNFSLTPNGTSGGPVDPPVDPPAPTPVAINADGIIGPNNEAPLIGASQLPHPNSLPLGDGFQIHQRNVTANIPFAMLDDSLSIFPTDNQGIIREGDSGAFFGVTDLVNGEPVSEFNPGNGTGTADFRFDIAGLTNLEVAIDMAAMGDFDSSPVRDTYDFSYSVDGAAFQSLFTSTIDESGSLSYLLEGGASINLNDPLLINGTMLNNFLQTLTAGVIGTGNVLTLRFFATTDGGDEAFVFRNIEVTGTPTVGQGAAVPEPTTGLLAVAGLMVMGLTRSRRRA